MVGVVFDRIYLSFAQPLPPDGSLVLEADWDSGPGGGTAQLVPEPASGALLALGLGLLARRRSRAAAPLR
jgi:hypothetical protein